MDIVGDGRGTSRRALLVRAGGITAAAVAAQVVGAPNALAARRPTRWGSPATTPRPSAPSSWGSGGTPTPAPTTPAPPTIAPGLPTYPLPTGPAVANLLGTDPVWHLVRRATYGPTPELIAEVRSKGTSAWLEEQLAPQAIDDSACEAFVGASYLGLPMSITQLRSVLPVGNYAAAVQLGYAKVARSVLSKRQLFEMMVEFWHDHLHAASPTSEMWDVITTYDRDVIRRHALGRFADLLLGSAQSAAMLRILNNYESTATTLNENYGRELLELHTVGVESGYTQAEVVDSARIMTGWTLDRDGVFTYRSDLHYVGPVRVLDFAQANADRTAGLSLGTQYLNYLAHHPATARHLAWKLAVRFVSDFPPAALVDRLATVYLENDTAIVPVLRTLFTSGEFQSSFGQKLRRPFEDLTATLRTLGVSPGTAASSAFSGMYWKLDSVQQRPMAWPAPNGYPDTATAWLSTSGMLNRWTLHRGAVSHWWNDGFLTQPTSSLLGGVTPSTVDALVDLLTLRLLGVRFLGQDRTAVLNFLAATGPLTVASVTGNRLDALVTLILSSPYALQR